MKKFFCKSMLMAVLFVLLQPPKKADAQICPAQVYNNTTTIGVVSPGLYNSIQPGVYNINMISSEMTFLTCWLVPGPGGPPQVTITKSQDVLGVISGTAGSGGWGIYFDVSGPLATNGCTDPLPLDVNLPNEWNGIQTGSFSLQLTPVPGGGGNVAFTINYTDGIMDECVGIVVPVVWGPFTTTKLSSPNRVRLDWTTYTEQNVDHFTIEKSSNGFVTYFKVAQVAAVGNSNAQNNYTWTDNNPVTDGYYRVVSVDFDCRRNYTPIRRVTCSSGCPSTFTPPNIPQDCTPPNTSPYISGPASICDNTTRLYRLNNVLGDAQVTWSIYPSNLATLVQASRLVGVVPTGNNGTGTLTATVVKNGVTSYYNYEIGFGAPALYGSCQIGPVDYCNNSFEFIATVYMFPGTNWSDYHWYQNGYYVGTGDQRTWMVWQGQVINFEVHYYGPCGESVWYGSSEGCDAPWKNATTSNKTVAPTKETKPRFLVSPNPARSDISIQRIPPCEDPWEPQPWKMKAPSTVAPNNTTAMIKVFDAQGKLRKTTSMSAASTRLTVNAGDLPAGLYFVHVIEPGKETVTLKVLLEK